MVWNGCLRVKYLSVGRWSTKFIFSFLSNGFLLASGCTSLVPVITGDTYTSPQLCSHLSRYSQRNIQVSLSKTLQLYCNTYFSLDIPPLMVYHMHLPGKILFSIDIDSDLQPSNREFWTVCTHYLFQYSDSDCDQITENFEKFAHVVYLQSFSFEKDSKSEKQEGVIYCWSHEKLRWIYCVL